MVWRGVGGEVAVESCTRCFLSRHEAQEQAAGLVWLLAGPVDFQGPGGHGLLRVKGRVVGCAVGGRGAAVSRPRYGMDKTRAQGTCCGSSA